MSNGRATLQRWLADASREHAKSREPRHAYSCIEDLVLDRGMVFDSAPLSTTQLAIVLAAARRARSGMVLTDFGVQHCFANSAHLVLSDRHGELTYVEGFAIGTVCPVHHAWAIIGGKVVDVTWRHTNQPVVVVDHDLADRIMGQYGSGRAYIGIPFSRELVLARFLDPATSTPFFDDPSWFNQRMMSTRKSQAPWEQTER